MPYTWASTTISVASQRTTVTAASRRIRAARARTQLLVPLGQLPEVPLELPDLLQGSVGLQRQSLHLSAALGQGERAGATVRVERNCHRPNRSDRR